MSELQSETLRQILHHELDEGNSVASRETGWSKMDLVVRMKRPLDREFVHAHASSSCHTFSSDDPHNGPPEFGIVCGAESIVGPKS